MSLVLLQGGRVVDPANNRDETADVLLSDGKIQSVGTNLSIQMVRRLLIA